MRICENGVYRDLTEEEIKQMEQATAQAEVEYWQTISYDEAVNNEIRKQYSQSAEFAILRQKDEKPNEYSTYYNYCEQCKAYVKEMVEKYREVK